MYVRPAICSALACLLLADPALAQKKPKKEKIEETQVLDLPEEPPQAVTAAADRLVFHVSPLSAKGLLSQQIRDAIKALRNATKGAQIVKIRAFVVGSGDMRRVPAIVSDVFSDKRKGVPAVSVIQAGALPLDGAQVVLESVSVDKKVANPAGIAFIPGQAAKVQDAVGPLKAALGDMEPRAITCFLASLDQVNGVRSQITAAYPKAAANYVQLRRDSIGDFVSCEATAAAATAPAQGVEYRQSAVITGPGNIVLTGTQLAFGAGEQDIRLAFERMDKALGAVGAQLSDTLTMHLYSLSTSATESARKVRLTVYEGSKLPAETLLVFEGLPSHDALLGLEVVTTGK